MSVLLLQPFNAMFEAAIEGVPQNQSRGRSLVFEMQGEGNLPRITINKPSARNKKGQPIALFQRSLLGRSQRLPLVLSNEGSLPCKVDVDVHDPDGVFTLVAAPDTQFVRALNSGDASRKAHAASVIVDVNATATFDIVFW